MDDITLSLLVVAGAALITAAVLLLNRRAAKRREEALAAYCGANNYRLTMTKESTARGIVIEGDGWRIESAMRALVNSAETGSSGWQRETAFVCDMNNPVRKTFALMISGGSSDLDAVPSWVRETAVSQLRAHLGVEMLGLNSVRTVRFQNGRSGLLFETEPSAADAALELLRQPLAAWSGKPPLYLECSPEKISVRLPDTAIKSAEEIDAILRIGLTPR